MRTLQAQLWAPVGAQLGEGPVWDPDTRQLLFVDIVAGRLYRSPQGGPPTVLAELDRPLGAALPSTVAGEFLLVARDGFHHLAADGTVRPLLPVLADRPDLRFNDAKCDPAGRCLAGTLSTRDDPARATLYRLDAGPVASPLVTGVHLANGLGWSPDGATFYFADTVAARVDRFDYDPSSGALSGRRVFASEPSPDGLCVDDDGGVWIASWDEGLVRRYSPAGQPDTIVELPVPHATSCAFADGLLLITTASTGLDGAGRRAAPHAGDVFAVEPGVGGRPATRWCPLEAS